MDVTHARKGLGIYFAGLLALSVPLEWLFLRNGEPIERQQGLILMLMWSPTVASMIARLALREGLRDVSFALKGATGVRTLLIGWLFPLAVGLAAYGIGWSTGLAPFSSSASRLAASLALTLTAGVLLGIINTFGEEIGWRGYMLTRLFDAGVPRPVLVSSLIWGAWHVPMILTGQYASGGNPILSAIIFLGMIVPITYLVSWLRLESGSVWPAILCHSSWNALIQGVFDIATRGRSIWLGESGILVVGVSLLLVLFLVRGRWTIRHFPDEEAPKVVRASEV